MKRRDFLTGIAALGLTGKSEAQWARFQATSTAGNVVDFVSTFGAPINGSGDCGPAVIAWRSYAFAHPGATLTIPAHVYQLEIATLIGSDTGGGSGRYPDTLQIPSCSIIAAPGTIIKSWFSCGSRNAFTPNVSGGGFINTCFAGNNTITLKSSGDLSHVSVNGWISVNGICTQAQSQPPNPQRYEFHRVTNISGLVLTLDSPLRYSYSDTWPDSTDIPSTGGPACFMSMGPGHGSTAWWDNSYTVSGMTIMCGDRTGDAVMNSSGVITTPPSGNGFVFYPLRTLICNDVTFHGPPPGVSYCETFTCTGCTMTDFTAETDKACTTLIYDHCTIGHLQIQSASPEFLIVRNGCVFTEGFSSDGTGKHCTISDSTINGTFNTGSGHGRLESLVITNTPINNAAHYPDFSGRNIGANVIASMVYLGSGLFIFSSDVNNDVLSFQQAVVPGFQYAFAYQTEIYPDPQFTVPPIYFCVTDISEAPGSNFVNWYMQTDMTYVAAGADGMDNFPTNTYLGNNWNVWQCIPYKAFTIDGVNQVTVAPQFIATVNCPADTD